MELNRSEGLPGVADALVGSVIEILEPGTPVLRQRFGVDREAVILAGHEAVVRAALDDGLVLAAVPVLEFVCVRPDRERQELLAGYRRFRTILEKDPQNAERMVPRQIPGVTSIEVGAWTGVCGVMLNLHEFITRD